MIDLLGVTMQELRGGCRERRLCDARSLLAAALPVTQCQMAELLDCSRQAVGKMRQRHATLLRCDENYRTKWEAIVPLSDQIKSQISDSNPQQL